MAQDLVVSMGAALRSFPGAAVTTLVFAYGAGLLSTVNPCGFALLPGFVAYYLGSREVPSRLSSGDHLLQGLAVGISVSAGFAGVFVLVGLVLSLGLREVLGALPWAGVAIGIILAAVGVAMIAGRPVGMTLPVGIPELRSHGYRRAVLFGGGYALASLSCTVAVLLAVVAQALAAGTSAGVIGVFLAYAAGAATILVGVSVVTAVARDLLSRGIRRLMPAVGWLSGLLLALSGTYLVTYWLPQVIHRGSGVPRPIAVFSQSVSGALSALVETHQTLIAAGGVLLVLAGIAVATRRQGRARRRRRSTPSAKGISSLS